MLLRGSCHCGLVRFEVQSHHPVPYMRCYCSICRKTGGGGGYCINVSADAATLMVTGRDKVRVYRAQRGPAGELSTHERHFCGECGSHLWAYDGRWPHLVHPVAGAVDTPLPAPPENVHIMLGSRAGWVPVEGKPEDARFDEYPDQSIADWHDQRKLTVD